MKAFILQDEMGQFHWSMLKSVLLILTILPVTQGAFNLWNSTQGSSQIVVGFFALSLLSTWAILSFWAALKATVLTIGNIQATAFELKLVRLYCYMPMLFLAAILCYLVSQI